MEKLNSRSVSQVLETGSTNVIQIIILKFILSDRINEVSSLTFHVTEFFFFFFYQKSSCGILARNFAESQCHLFAFITASLLCIFFWYSPRIVNCDCHVIKSPLITRVCFYAEISVGSLLQDPQINKDVPSRIAKRLGLSRAPELIRNDFSFSFHFQCIFNCFFFHFQCALPPFLHWHFCPEICRDSS